MDLIPFSDEYIPEAQAEAIVSIIAHQCDLIEARDAQNEIDYPELYDDDYLSGRKHSYAANIYAGFQETTVLPGMEITKRSYRKIHRQPQIESNTAVVQIYSSEVKFSSDEIKTKCSEYNNEGSEKRFLVLQFWTSKRGHLTRVEVVHFNESVDVISRTVIFKFRAQPIRIAA